jgi:hypothetical protein
MGQASVNEGARRRRGSRGLPFIWLPALAAVLAAFAFPGAAGAATPASTPCPALVAGAPCYTVAPTIQLPSELANPPEGRTLWLPATNNIPGTWSPATLTGSNFSYQWQDCDAATGLTCSNAAGPGATTRTYLVSSTDVGSRLQVIATVKNPSGTGYWVWQSTGAVVAAVPINRARPTVTGVTQDGQPLTSSTGTWGGTMPISYGYQWQRCDGAGLNCGKAFPSPPSSSPSYTLTDADLGHTMVVYVTATNAAGSASTHSSVTSTVVTPGNTALPTIGGTAQEGKTLIEAHGSWIPKNPSGYSYQWQDCDASGNNCSAIAGANSQNYTATGADVGHTLRVLESATAGGITSAPASSGATGVVKPGTPAQSGNGGGGQSGGGQSGGGNAGQGTSTGPVTINKAQIRGLLLRVLAAKGNAGTIRGVLKHGGYKFTFLAPSPGRLVISWYNKQTLVASVALVFHKSGRANAVVFLTSSGRSLLSGQKRMRVTAKGAFTPAGHGTIRASKRIMLKA